MVLIRRISGMAAQIDLKNPLKKIMKKIFVLAE